MPEMTLMALLALVDHAYMGDGEVMRAYAERPAEPGDTMALFLAQDIARTFESGEDRASNLRIAAETVELAISNLREVLSALEAARKGLDKN